MDDFQNIINSFSSSATTTGGSSPREEDPVIKALTERLTRQGEGIASSSSSGIQSEIEQAMRDTQRAGDSTAARLQSERGREIGFAQDRAGAQFTTALEGRSGYATQVAGLRELTETTEKSIRDLDGRYQEAMLANDANTASQMSQLRMQKLEFLDKQEQQFYQNLFSLAGLREQQAGREQQESQFQRGMTHDQIMMREKFGFDFAMVEKETRRDERNMLLGLAAQHGVEIGEDETMESMIAKISPFIGQQRALELEAMRADINRSNAEIQRAMAGARKDNERLSDVDVDAFAVAYKKMPEGSQLLLGLSDSDAGKVITKVGEMDAATVEDLKEKAKGYTNSAKFIQDMDEEGVHELSLVQEAARSITNVQTPGLFSRISTKLKANSSEAPSSRLWAVME